MCEKMMNACEKMMNAYLRKASLGDIVLVNIPLFSLRSTGFLVQTIDRESVIIDSSLKIRLIFTKLRIV